MTYEKTYKYSLNLWNEIYEFVKEIIIILIAQINRLIICYIFAIFKYICYISAIFKCYLKFYFNIFSISYHFKITQCVANRKLILL